MTILMVSPYFYPEGGGLEGYAYQIAKSLSKNNKVTVVCFTRGAPRTEKIGEITVYRLKPLFILSNTPVGFSIIPTILQILKKEKVELIIGHTPVPFAVDVASLLAKLFRIPLKIVYHTVGLEKGFKGLDLIGRIYAMTLERITLRNSELISVSEIVWEHLKSKGYNSRIKPPGISEELRKTKVKENVRKEKAILFVGQLGKYHRFKNLDMLIKVFAEVSKEFPEWKLWVVGDGDLMDYYKKIALELGLKDKVIFFGRINNSEELAKVYSRAKLFVLPSSFESFGITVLESLHFGTPVVVNEKVGAARRLVFHGKNGFLFKTEKDLARILKTLMENPKTLKKLSKKHSQNIQLKIR